MKRPWIAIFAMVVLGGAIAFAAGKMYWIPATLVCVAGVFVWRKKTRFLAIAFLIGVLRMCMQDAYYNSDVYLSAESSFSKTFRFAALGNCFEKDIQQTDTRQGYEDSENTTAISLKIDNITKSGAYKRLECGRVMVYVKTEDSGQGEHKTGNSISAADEYKIGNRISVEGDVEEIEGARNPGEFDFKMYYRSMGITHRCFADSVTVVDMHINKPAQLLYDIRSILLENLSGIFDEDDAGFLRAALLGDKSMMSDEMNDMYRKNGIAHLLAISGLHISIMGLGLYKALRKSGLGYGISGIAAGCWLILYSMLTGSAVSTVRAVLMLLMVFLADHERRTYDQLSALGLAGTAIIIYQPYRMFACSFLLSFAAVAAIGGPATYINRKLKRRFPVLKEEGFASGLVSSLVTSSAVQLCTLPVTSYFFFEVSTYGFLINLIVIPLMTYVVWSGLAALVLSFVSAEAAAFAGGSAHYILKFYRIICESMEKLPGRIMTIGRPTVIAGMALTSVVSLGKNIDITFIDVGQGDGIYMDIGSEDILVDCGSSSDRQIGKNTLKSFIEARGSTSFDKVFITHADSDHTSGILYVLEDEEMSVDTLYLPQSAKEGEKYGDIKEAAYTVGTKIIYIGAGDEIEVEKGKLTCLAAGECPGQDTNDDSIVLLYEYGDFSMLLMGDASKEVEQQIVTEFAPGRVTVLKCGHHGSSTSTGEELLDEVSPLYAVLSYGEGNRYGHPHEETIERLKVHGAQIISTAKSGAIMLHTDGKSLRTEKYCLCN